MATTKDVEMSHLSCIQEKADMTFSLSKVVQEEERGANLGVD